MWPAIIFAIDIAYKWHMVFRVGTVLGAVALLLLHALLLKCCKISGATWLQVCQVRGFGSPTERERA